VENVSIEKSINKTYRKTIFRPFIEAIKEFELIKPNDKIAVCISGGKDSFLLAKCLQILKKHKEFVFDLEFIVMDPGYSKENINQIKKNLKLFEIDAHIFKAPIFNFIENTEKPCYLCAKMRRGYLYDKAQELGCNKIALGHHFNDVIETVILNMVFNGVYASMMPKLKSDNFENMELIRPLYYIKEKDIINFKNYNNLVFLDCACVITKKDIGKRKEVKDFIDNMKKLYPQVDSNILNSTKNVNLNKVIGCEKDGKDIFFLDDY